MFGVRHFWWLCGTGSARAQGRAEDGRAAGGVDVGGSEDSTDGYHHAAVGDGGGRCPGPEGGIGIRAPREASLEADSRDRASKFLTHLAPGGASASRTGAWPGKGVDRLA